MAFTPPEQRRYRVCVVETREYFYEVEAFDADDAKDIAMDLDVDDSVSDAFRERTVDWAERI